MPGEGPASTPCDADRDKGVDGRPAPAMTGEASVRQVKRLFCIRPLGRRARPTADAYDPETSIRGRILMTAIGASAISLPVQGSHSHTRLKERNMVAGVFAAEIKPTTGPLSVRQFLRHPASLSGNVGVSLSGGGS